MNYQELETEPFAKALASGEEWRPVLTLENNGQSIELGVRIPWIAILLAAAKEVGAAMAKRLGENLADKLTEALFGSSGDTGYREEIVTRLIRIEAKLDQIIQYLQNELPHVVQQAVASAFVNDRRYQLELSRSSVQAALKAFHNSQSLTTAEHLEKTLFEALREGGILLKYGWHCHASGVEALAMTLPAYSELLRYKYKRFAGVIDPFMMEYIATMKPWLDEKHPGNLITVLKNTIALEDEARTLAPSIQTNGTPFLLATRGPWGTGCHVELCNPGDQGLWIYDAFKGWFSGTAGDAIVPDDWTSAGAAQVPYQNVQAPPPPIPLNNFNAQPAAWWPVAHKGNYGWSKDELWDLWHTAINRANTIRYRANHYPQLVKELETSRDAIESAITAAGKILLASGT